MGGYFGYYYFFSTEYFRVQLQKEYKGSNVGPLSMVHFDLWDSKMNFLYGGLKKKGIKSRIKNFLRQFVL
jgi:hypothetical protein